jgi:hypothetical protein
MSGLLRRFKWHSVEQTAFPCQRSIAEGLVLGLAQKYDYRYSVLSNVFGRLLAEGWLTEAEIAPLQPEKIEQIKRSASAWREES